MTSVWFASTGSGEDGDEWDVRGVFATKELAEAYCNRPDKPRWEHASAEEWEVEGSLLTDEEREAIDLACVNLMETVRRAVQKCHAEADFAPFSRARVTLRGMLERLA